MKGHDQSRSENNRSERFIADLRGLVWQRIDPGGGFKSLAQQANLSEQTIIRLMWHQPPKYPQTKRPHFETIVRLLWALERLDLLDAVFASEHRPIKRGRKPQRPLKSR